MVRNTVIGSIVVAPYSIEPPQPDIVISGSATHLSNIAHMHLFRLANFPKAPTSNCGDSQRPNDCAGSTKAALMSINCV